MKPNFEKEVAFLSKRLQDETLKAVRIQALLDDALEENNQLKKMDGAQNTAHQDTPQLKTVEDE